MAKSRKGKNDGDGQFEIGVMLRAFSERLAKEKLSPTPSEMLVELMNGDVLSSDGKMRVERIIQLVRGQKEYVSLISMRVREQGTPVITEAYRMTLIDISNQLNEELSRYAVIPQTQSFFPEPFHYFLPADSNSRSPAEMAEVSAVMGAVLLAQQSQINNVRECSCGMFFVAGRIDQNHCSTKCRVKDHQSSDEFKAKRREADRARYRLHKDGKVKETNRRKSNGTKKAR